MNSMKKLLKTSHYLLARLVVQKLVDNEALLCSVNESTNGQTINYVGTDNMSGLIILFMHKNYG